MRVKKKKKKSQRILRVSFFSLPRYSWHARERDEICVNEIRRKDSIYTLKYYPVWACVYKFKVRYFSLKAREAIGKKKDSKKGVSSQPYCVTIRSNNKRLFWYKLFFLIGKCINVWECHRRNRCYISHQLFAPLQVEFQFRDLKGHQSAGGRSRDIHRNLLDVHTDIKRALRTLEPPDNITPAHRERERRFCCCGFFLLLLFTRLIESISRAGLFVSAPCAKLGFIISRLVWTVCHPVMMRR